MCWKRWIVSSGSSVLTEMHLLMCSMASVACWFQEHAVSMAINMKTCVTVRTTYLVVFEFAALLDGGGVNVQVCKGVWNGYIPCRGFPLDHGSNVTPSGLLLSLVVKPRGSFVEGTWACLIALQTISLTCECLCCLAELQQQNSPGWSDQQPGHKATASPEYCTSPLQNSVQTVSNDA